MSYVRLITRWYVMVLGACALMLTSVAYSAPTISLKQNSVVTDGTIKLGDVFYGLPHDEDKVLGIAPRPGQDMVLNARTLLRIAVALDLPWRPTSSADYVVLTRAATLVDHEMVEEALRDALDQKDVHENYNLLIDQSHAEIILPQDVAAGVEVTRIKTNADNSRFEATLAAPSKDNPIQRINVTGKIQKLVKVPVLNAALNNGAIIGQRDIDYTDIPEHALKHGIILKAENLIGTTPRRLIREGKPVQATEVEAPRIVTRGDIVTMVFKHGGMTLTAAGKALEHGAKGDVIRVANTTSSKTLEAVVTASKEVTINNAF